MKAFITKYALSEGILEFEGELVNDCGSKPWFRVPGRFSGFFGNSWHLSLSVAVERAEQMRRDKIESLKKQIAKLEKLRFDGAKPGRDR